MEPCLSHFKFVSVGGSRPSQGFVYVAYTCTISSHTGYRIQTANTQFWFPERVLNCTGKHITSCFQNTMLCSFNVLLMTCLGVIQTYKHFKHTAVNCKVNIIIVALIKPKAFCFTANCLKGFANTENKTLASIFNKNSNKILINLQDQVARF